MTDAIQDGGQGSGSMGRDSSASYKSPKSSRFDQGYANSLLRARLEAIEAVRHDLESDDIEVPGIVVVGNQSAGKSSVLESISGINFPRGENTCTRCATIVQLEADPDVHKPYCVVTSMSDGVARGHGKKIFDFELIGSEIERLTKELAGAANVSTGTILLDGIISISIKTCTGPTMTLIDLPGLTYVNDKQKNIHDVCVELIRRYIANEQTVILAVVPATEDFGNCEALALAAEFDPQGTRTLGVVTKCDMATRDSDIVQKIAMVRPSDIKLRLGFIGVKCRSPAEIKDGVTLEEMAALERGLFTQSSVFIQHKKVLEKSMWGMDTLVSKICEVQDATVSKWMPKVKAQLRELITKRESELDEISKGIPDDLESKRRRLLSIVVDVDRSLYQLANCLEFRDDDPSLNVSARVRGIFGRMKNSVRKSVPRFLDLESARSVGKLLRESKPHGLPNFVSDVVFSHVARKYILPHLQQNAKYLLEELHQYVLLVITSLIDEKGKEYPKLVEQLKIVAGKVLESQLAAARTHVMQLCEAEMKMVYVSEEDRYMAILGEISNTVKSLVPLINGQIQNSSGNMRASNIGSSGNPPPGPNGGQNQQGGQNNGQRSNTSTIETVWPLLREDQQIAIANLKEKYGVEKEDVLQLANFDANIEPEEDNGRRETPNFAFSTSATMRKEVKETQVSLLAYSHIVQGRFVDTACMISHNFMITDLQLKLQEGFHEIGSDGPRLEACLESDPIIIEKRKKLMESVKRLKASAAKLDDV